MVPDGAFVEEGFQVRPITPLSLARYPAGMAISGTVAVSPARRDAHHEFGDDCPPPPDRDSDRAPLPPLPPRQLGDFLQWLAFFAPWFALTLYLHVALVLHLGPLGLLEAPAMSLAVLPFWRALCGRPVFLPHLALLARYHAKLAPPAFEDTSPAGLADRPHLAWVRDVQLRIDTFQAELHRFVDAQTVRPPAEPADDSWWMRRGTDAENEPVDVSETSDAGDRTPRGAESDAGSERAGGTFGAGDRDAAAASAAVSPSSARRRRRSAAARRCPALRMRRSGLDALPLCDGTLTRPNAMAARHFPETLAAVAAAGGFQPTLWTLSPDDPATRASARPTTGTSDGYWRAHVILAADESPAGDGEGYAVDAETLRESAGVWVEGETRAVEVGRVLVVNDHLRRRWYHRGSGSIGGSAGKDRDRHGPGAGGEAGTGTGGERERAGERREGSASRAGAVVLTFDVMRPECAASRTAVIRHRSRAVRALGEHPAGASAWRAVATAISGNLT